MALDKIKVAVAMGSGLSAVCATCSNYWEARDNGVPGQACLSKTRCGSPIAGDTFHDYHGPIYAFDKFCFVCGNAATHAVRVAGHVRVVGTCTTHVEFVKTLKPQGRQAATVTIIGKDGEDAVSADEIPDAPKIKLRLDL